MNSNPQSPQYGQIKKWDELTKEEQESGDWFKLPDGVHWTNSRVNLTYEELKAEANAQIEAELAELQNAITIHTISPEELEEKAAIGVSPDDSE